MMASLRHFACLLLAISPAHGLAQAAEEENGRVSTPDNGLIVLTGTHQRDTTDRITPTGPYQSITSTITLATTTTGPEESLGSTGANSTGQVELATDTETNTVTYLTGGRPTTSTVSGGGNATTTDAKTAGPIPTNTRPCNNYPEFCERKYSDITEVGCHNSPFFRPGSAASNQQYPVTDQLNDGVRFLQGQIQWPANATAGQEPHFCHTSCELLDGGPITAWLTEIKQWVAAHPYDVVTILLGNGNYSTPDLYVPHIESTGLLQYVYTPPLAPLSRGDWPTLASMILSGQRVVMFLDYVANQTAYPWLLDQFSHMWETPFDPVDNTFPCVVQRPPDLSREDTLKRMYLMNHNLNVEVSLLGNSILVPAVSELNKTNAAEGEGSVGLAAQNCMKAWDGQAPKVLNVDYYNYGSFPGSVFEAAARVNNVTYSRPCCGAGASAAGRVEVDGGLKMASWGLVAGWLVMWVVG